MPTCATRSHDRHFRPDLVVLGASVRAAAHSAVRGGFAPYAIDLFADRDLAAACTVTRVARYPHDFRAALAAAPEAAWVYTGGLENYPALVDRLAAVRPLVGNAGHVLRRVRDVRQLAEVAAEAGCPLPGRGDGRPLVVKPRRGSGGLGIRLATADDSRRLPRGLMLQEFVPGEAASGIFVAAAGRAVLVGVTRQLLGRDFDLARPFLYVGSLGPLVLEPAEQAALVRLGNLLAERFELCGLFNVDFVRGAEGLATMEVNPRYSASVEVLERSLGWSSIAAHLAACWEGQLPAAPTPNAPTPTEGPYVGKAVVYADGDGRVPEELDDLIAKWNRPGQWPLLADLPRGGDSLRKDQPVLTVFAEGGSLAEAETELRRRVALVQAMIRVSGI